MSENNASKRKVNSMDELKDIYGNILVADCGTPLQYGHIVEYPLGNLQRIKGKVVEDKKTGEPRIVPIEGFIYSGRNGDEEKKTTDDDFESIWGRDSVLNTYTSGRVKIIKEGE